MSQRLDWSTLPMSWRAQAFTSLGTILLESVRPSAEQHHSFLFQHPIRTLQLWSAADLTDFFQRIEQALQDGLHLAGFFTYECGAALQDLPLCRRDQNGPLAHLNAYAAPRIFDHTAHHPQEVSDITPALDLAMLPLADRNDYLQQVAAVQQWIAAGDTYQLNLTTAVGSTYTDDPHQLYSGLVQQQPCSYAAVLRLDPTQTILSFSPELFFTTDQNRRILMRPMKGTAPRTASPNQDSIAAQALALDPKNRAEHLMIVDLLRSDIGRLATMGSVQVTDLFTIETYLSVHQMVSSVQGRVKPDITWRQIFEALFPSGSITGAPKRHTMELINRLETRPRGIYTGAIGHIAPNGSSTFSVAIRTLVLDHPRRFATMGIGSGIVADSVPADEYRECLLKASFLFRASQTLQLVETMLVQNGSIPRLNQHLRRLQESALALDFPFEEHLIQAKLEAALQACIAKQSARLRLTLGRDGISHLTLTHLPTWPNILRITLARETINPDDPTLRHKTTHRHLYDKALAQAQQSGFHEALFQNTRGELTEGCITSLFLQRNGQLFTPPLTSGVLPGILRAELLASGHAQEATLHLSDLAQASALYLGNSLRGLHPVASLQLPSGKTNTYKAMHIPMPSAPQKATLS